jgi:hypothetical protein
MHMNIYVFFQNLNILCSFWSTVFFFGFFFFWFFSGPVWFRIFGVDRFGLVSGSDNIDDITLEHDMCTLERSTSLVLAYKCSL